eukprot:3772273-Rhodomonas_salina.1
MPNVADLSHSLVLEIRPQVEGKDGRRDRKEGSWAGGGEDQQLRARYSQKKKISHRRCSVLEGEGEGRK